MRKVILDLAVTLDGFMEGPNGEIDWCIMDDDMDFQGFLSSIDTIFYGRLSYDSWGHFQPEANASASEVQLWQAVHSKKKYVFTTQHRQDPNATYIHDHIADQVAIIKQQEGNNIWLYGGASLITTFIDLNLIDRYRLSVHPLALGSGKPLFAQLQQPLLLKLTDSRVFKSGVVQLVYEPQPQQP